MSDQDLVDKLVIDNSGNVIGKCIDVKDNHEEENMLVVEIQTKENGIVSTDIPMSTIQAIGKTIVLAVEIEGLVDSTEVLPYEDVNDNNDVPVDKTEDDENDSDMWVIYKNIKSRK